MSDSTDRGHGVALPRQNEAVALPYRPFLFTLDQISVILDLDEKIITKSYIYFEGRSIGSRHKHLMIARNIAAPDCHPEWRVAERELVRWMRFKGFRYYERGVSAN
jgi:hypothetical protein